MTFQELETLESQLKPFQTICSASAGDESNMRAKTLDRPTFTLFTNVLVKANV